MTTDYFRGRGCIRIRVARGLIFQQAVPTGSPRRHAMPGPEPGRRANRPRWRTGAAGCMAARPRAPEGNSHAFKHGRYTAEHIAERRHFAELLREMKDFIDEIDGAE